jgi:hypothetical protein
MTQDDPGAGPALMLVACAARCRLSREFRSAFSMSCRYRDNSPETTCVRYPNVVNSEEVMYADGCGWMRITCTTAPARTCCSSLRLKMTCRADPTLTWLRVSTPSISKAYEEATKGDG